MELQLSRPAPDDNPRPLAQRPTLTLRDPGIERLMRAIPVTPDNPDDVRGWARALTASASRWEIERAKSRAQARQTLFGGIRK